jgi:hypothetical protein
MRSREEYKSNYYCTKKKKGGIIMNDITHNSQLDKAYGYGYNNGINDLLLAILQVADENRNYTHIKINYVEELAQKLKEGNIKKRGID